MLIACKWRGKMLENRNFFISHSTLNNKIIEGSSRPNPLNKKNMLIEIERESKEMISKYENNNEILKNK